MTSSNLIRDMIPVISKLGWIKGNARTLQGVCIYGAWCEVGEINGTKPLEWIIIEEVIKEQFPDRYIPDQIFPAPMPYFNDHEKTVIEDVIMVLEKAAIKWDERI